MGGVGVPVLSRLNLSHSGNRHSKASSALYEPWCNLLRGQQTATTASFFHAMAITSSAQRKAQEELDVVVGPTRLPTFDDLSSLPYLQAVLLEVMRWSPTVPLGIQHRSLHDDEYNGYFIPAGTVVYGVRWFIFAPSSGSLDSSEHMVRHSMVSNSRCLHESVGPYCVTPQCTRAIQTSSDRIGSCSTES